MNRQIATIAVLLAVVCGATLFVIARKHTEGSIPPQETIAIPPFKTAIEGVEITSAKVILDAGGSPTLEVEIKNNTAGGIMWILLSSGHTHQGRGSKTTPAL